MFVVTIIVSPEGTWALSTSAPPGFAIASREQVAQSLRNALAVLDTPSESEPVPAEPVAEPEA